MKNTLFTSALEFTGQDVANYLNMLRDNPIKIVMLIIDVAIVLFLAIKLLQIVKETRAWQLIKGIAFLVIFTLISSVLELHILNYILTSFMTYGVILLIIIFQPELRRALEQLGTSKLTRFFGIDKDIATKTKENIYKIVIAATELAKSKTGALIVIERDIKLKDIVDTGISIDGEISPQLLVNIFNPKTPLHDGAVIISENKVKAAACLLPLSDDKNISKGLGTRHRSAAGISQESDAIVVIVSEETGKISIAKDGTLIIDVKEDALRQILIKNIVTKRFGNEEIKKRKARLKEKMKNLKKNKKSEENKEDTKSETK